jgi:prevent-host-death family protein
MKPLNISQHIVSLSEFKARASKMIHDVQDSHRPLVITQNGKAAAVLISPADFDDLMEKVRFMDGVQKGLADVEHGRIIPDESLGISP